jgi:hypothetical protein
MQETVALIHLVFAGSRSMDEYLPSLDDTPQSQTPDNSKEPAHEAYIYKDQPSWPIYVSNCIYETYDLGGYLHRIR